MVYKDVQRVLDAALSMKKNYAEITDKEEKKAFCYEVLYKCNNHCRSEYNWGKKTELLDMPVGSFKQIKWAGDIDYKSWGSIASCLKKDCGASFKFNHWSVQDFFTIYREK